MTFKWTYIAAGLLTVAAIVVSLPIDGGFWGAVSYIHGIVLVAIGDGLVLFTRTRKQRPHAEGDVPFVSYPEHQVLAILESRDEAARAVREMRNEKLHDHLNLYHGEIGAAAIDSEGMVHGVGGVTSRSVEHLMTDLDDLTNYDEAIRSGSVVIAFNGRDAETRRRGAAILKSHGAHDIQYFGPMSVEVLDVDRSRTRAS